MEYVWIVEHQPCIYESTPYVVSIHKTAVSAFRAMRDLRDVETEKETWEALKYLGYFLSSEASGNKARGFKGDKNDWWVRIRKVEISQ